MGRLTFSCSGVFLDYSHRFKLAGLSFLLLPWINERQLSEPRWACGHRDPCPPSQQLWPFWLSALSAYAPFADPPLGASHFALQTERTLFKVT